MPNTFFPAHPVYKSGVDTSRRITDALFSGMEKMDHIGREAAHRFLLQQFAVCQGLSTASDVHGVTNALQLNTASTRLNDAMRFQTDMMRAVLDMQNEIGSSLREYGEQFRAHMGNSARMPMQPFARDDLHDPVSSVFSMWEAAFKEAAALAERTMAGARAGNGATAGAAARKASADTPG